MISIIITAYREPESVKKALRAILAQPMKQDYEILLVCPDEETGRCAKISKKARWIKDPGAGKPTALNIAFKQARGRILVFTDGDVYIGENALSLLIARCEEAGVGIVSGRPRSLNPRNTFFGYISHLLTDVGAHESRIRLDMEKKFLVCSGYLYALRKGLVTEIPKEALADDTVISYLVNKKGYRTVYEPRAEVYVRYPTNFKDWIAQKRRSTRGNIELKKFFGGRNEMRSFTKESRGIFSVFTYPQSLREVLWTILLVVLRFYLWILVFMDEKILKKDLKETWVRIESTKVKKGQKSL